MNVIDSNNLERDGTENRHPLFLIPLKMQSAGVLFRLQAKARSVDDEVFETLLRTLHRKKDFCLDKT